MDIELRSWRISTVRYQSQKEKRLLICRFSHYCSHTTWISWNDQSSKPVMEPSVSIVSFD